MSGEDDHKKVVNKNENHYWSWMRFADKSKMEERALHIQNADYLIKNFCTKELKNHPGTWEYQFLQYRLCTDLADKEASREYLLRMLASSLECSSVELWNDPDLPF